MSFLINTDLFMLMYICTVCMFSVQVAADRSCRWNQITILRPKGVECLACSECPDGEGLVPQCGSRVTADVKVQCVQCTTGESYSDKHDFSSCKPCTICDPNEETISACTATENAVCGECNAGFYRAVTGDCHPCSWCCSDSKDEDIEKQCSEQTDLPANHICRYDVNTIACAPTKNSTTAHAMLVHTTPAGSQDKVASQRREEYSASSTIQFIAFLSCIAIILCVFLGVMLRCFYKKQMLSQCLCRGPAGCGTAYPTQIVCNEPRYPQVVTGNEPSKEQMV